MIIFDVTLFAQSFERTDAIGEFISGQYAAIIWFANSSTGTKTIATVWVFDGTIFAFEMTFTKTEIFRGIVDQLMAFFIGMTRIA